MAKKSKESENKILGIPLKEETRQGVFVVIFFALALFSILSIFGVAGVAGKFFYKSLRYLFGIGYFLFTNTFYYSWNIFY